MALRSYGSLMTEFACDLSITVCLDSLDWNTVTFKGTVATVSPIRFALGDVKKLTKMGDRMYNTMELYPSPLMSTICTLCTPLTDVYLHVQCCLSIENPRPYTILAIFVPVPVTVTRNPEKLDSDVPRRLDVVGWYLPHQGWTAVS